MVQLAENKVIDLFQSDLSENVESFLTSKEMISRSEDTRLSYESDLRDFFHFLKPNRNMKSLTVKEVELGKDDILKYQQYLLIERELNVKTVKRRITTVQGLYEYLHSEDLIDNLKPFSRKTKMKELSNPHGILTREEVFQAMEVVMNQKRGRKKEIKKNLIQTAYDTCLRKSALLNLKWSDFVPYDEEHVEIKAIDKGNENQNRIIKKWFYDELLKMKDQSDSEFVFDISESAIQDMMDYIKREMNIHDKRNIVFHSFRKAGVTFQYQLTGDIMQAKKAAGHSNVNNTQLYVESTHNNMLGAISSDIEINNNTYEQLSHEQLLEVIEGLTKDQKFILNLKCREYLSKVVE